MKHLMPYPEYSIAKTVNSNSLVIGQQVRFKRKGNNSKLPSNQQSQFIGTGIVVEIKGATLKLECTDRQDVTIVMSDILR